jgi:D-beta-D-heptose 7-phosphate kinase/D-beta-D-heptose 1-phosphate adenosyltransferase
MDVALCTGGFDPLHQGHIEYLKAAGQFGKYLVVGLNSDEWLIRKKGKVFLPFEHRKAILESLKYVTDVITFDDSADHAINAIDKTLALYPESKVVFCNGGDRGTQNTPENLLRHQNVRFEYGVGGDNKLGSSSEFLKNWTETLVKTERRWGYYRVIYESPRNNIKVKELVVDPGKTLSLQCHSKRSEFWVVQEGTGTLVLADAYFENKKSFFLSENKSYHISEKTWHQLSNYSIEPLRIIEIQYGEECNEDDINRAK